MDEYTAELEGKMQRFFGWLSEKDRRRYAAIEAAKLGHGGIEYSRKLLASMLWFCLPPLTDEKIRESHEKQACSAMAPGRDAVWHSLGLAGTSAART